MMKSCVRSMILAAALLFSGMAYAYDGKVVDAQTKAPVEGASVTLGDRAVRTGKDGVFHIEGAGDKIGLRAAGYSRRDCPISELNGRAPEIPLAPFKVKGLYLSVYGIADKGLREAAIETIRENGMNALVIDVKGDRGLIPFKIGLPLADEIGAQKVITVKDVKALVENLRKQNLYLIARIVVFKDELLAAARPEWCVKAKNGAVFRDREKLRWVDPFRQEVRDYNIAIAKAAAEAGFDEIQFDYIRFPDNRGVTFSQPSTEESRTKAITGFLDDAYKALTPYNVMVAADIFGYVLWNTNDTDIGQKLAPIVNAVDVVSPMLYPSGFHVGIPKYRNPVQHPYEVVNLTLKRAVERTHCSSLRFRPWLQVFRDYAFGHKVFGEEEMRVQVKAAEDFGSSGWLFWNPRNVYPKKFTD